MGKSPKLVNLIFGFKCCALWFAIGLLSIDGRQLAIGAMPIEKIVWHPLTIDFSGPVIDGADSDPNPFLDFRLDVVFSGPDGNQFLVPAFFDGDGEGGSYGNVWRVKFTPDRPGLWRYAAAFRKGRNVAVRADYNQSPIVAFNGQEGSFFVKAQETPADGFLGKGKAVNEEGNYYFKTLGDGKFWIKGGTNSPENFLAYAGFSNTSPDPDQPEQFHLYEKHVRHWESGDPEMFGDLADGRGIIGALNYLASKHVNSILINLNNIGGDGKDVWPYRGKIDRRGNKENDNSHFDIEKLMQWEMVFSHAQKKGIFLHFVLNEGESKNKMELDNATLGVERKLFYREMIARFAHHNGIQWNLCEEYDGTQLPLDPDNIKAWAEYIKDTDPYDHPLTVHNWDPSAWKPFYGDERFDVVSYQYRGDMSYGVKVEQMRKQALEAGKVIPVCIDESHHTSREDTYGCFVSGWLHTCGQQSIRKKIIYPVYFSGGSVEFILEDLLETEDFEIYGPLWDYMYYARSFLQALPFWEMGPNDQLLTGEKGDGEVFSNKTTFAIFLPEGGDSFLDLREMPGFFIKRWYDPRKGVFVGAYSLIMGGRIVSLGLPPTDISDDWALLVELLSLKRSQ
jgi:hypothetical protein